MNMITENVGVEMHQNFICSGVASSSTEVS